MIEVENLSFRYDGAERPALREVNLTIGDGDYIALIGPNGCGKTTLIQHLNALFLPEAGTVKVDGMPTNDSRKVREIRRLVGMVFQNPDNQLVGMTVEEDIAFGPGNLGLPPSEIIKRVEESLHTVGLASFAKRPPHTLSGGEKRLVTIAGVLAMNPRYIAFDEPTSYLDPAGKERVLEVMKRLNREGLTIIHITHDMDEIAAASRVVVLKEGRVHQAGTPEEVCGRAETLKDLGLGVPKAMELLRKLQSRGEDVRTDILSIDGACDEITSWLKRKHPLPGIEKEDAGGERRV